MLKTKYTVRKYGGDGIHSYAVFKLEDVKGMSFQIFEGEAKPVTSGMGRYEANASKRRLENGKSS